MRGHATSASATNHWRLTRSADSLFALLPPSIGIPLPIVKVAPIYPDSAARRGLEGWVLLKFTVTETGAVRDPVVLESEPGTTFDRAAMKAVLKFKYKSRVEGGKPVEVPGVEHLITFKLEK